MEGWGTPGGLISMSPKANFWWLRKSAIKLLKRPSWTSFLPILHVVPKLRWRFLTLRSGFGLFRWIPKKWLWIQKLKKHLEKSHRRTDVYFFPSFIPFHSFIQNWEESPQPLVLGSLYNQPAKWIFLSSGGPQGNLLSPTHQLVSSDPEFLYPEGHPICKWGRESWACWELICWSVYMVRGNPALFICNQRKKALEWVERQEQTTSLKKNLLLTIMNCFQNLFWSLALSFYLG